MNILDEIVANTRAKVSIAKEKVSIDDMISTIHSTKIVKSKFKASLKDKDQAIIAEIKKASPSAGVIIEDFDPVTKAREYKACLLYTSPSPRDLAVSRMPSSA